MAMEKEKWNDISVETYREYLYESGFALRVDQPKLLRVDESSLGGHAHRIQTEDGKAYYVAPGWLAIRWGVREGNPLFKY